MTPPLLLLLAALGQAPAPSADSLLAIRNVTVIPATDAAVLKGATVLIRGRTIAAIGPVAAVPIPVGARIIEGRDKYLIPGLIDTHVHIAWAVGSPDMAKQLGLALAFGITGYREASAAGHERELVALRARIDSGLVLGPRLYVSGSGTPQNIPRYGASGLADLVRKLAALGVDGIKLRNLSSVQADTVIAAARAAGLPAFGHTYGGAGGAPPGDFTLRAIADGASGVMHALGIGPASHLADRRLLATDWEADWLRLYLYWIDATPAEEQRLLTAMVQANVWLEPTMAGNAFILHDEWYRGKPDARFSYTTYDSLRMGFPTWTGNDLTLAREGWRRMQRFLRRFERAGGLVLAGTDMVPWPGPGLHEELRLLVMSGLTPLEALQASTRNAARALGWERKTGTIQVGLDADLILLDADPLRNIRNTTRISTVIRAGQSLDWPILDYLARVAACRTGRPDHCVSP